MVAALACVLSPTWEFLTVARFVLGIAVGGASVTVPVFLAELAPTEQRGGLVSRNELMIVSGQLAAFAINAVIGNVWGEHDGVWRYHAQRRRSTGRRTVRRHAPVPESPAG